MELDDVADELYGLQPQEFTAARDDRARRARAGGQRELAADIRALRRPTLAAWASNLLVREQGQQVAPLLRLGEELRGAHRNLDGAELRALSHQQHQLVNALTEQAGRLASDAGQPLGPQAQHEVAQTLHAVLADPDAAQEWAAGRLAKPLTATPGFEAAAREAAASPAAHRRGTKAAPAGARPGARKGTDAPPRKQARKASQARKKQTADKAERAKRAEDARKAAGAAREAAEQARRRRREADRASEEKAAARAAREDAEERLGRLRAEIREAEEVRKQSRSREREAERSEREARRRAEDAEAADERARREADPTGTKG